MKSNLAWKRLRDSLCSPKCVESAEAGALNGGFSLHSWVRLNPHIIDMLLIRSNVIYNFQLIKKKSMRNLWEKNHASWITERALLFVLEKLGGNGQFKFLQSNLYLIQGKCKMF